MSDSVQKTIAFGELIAIKKKETDEPIVCH